MIEMMILKPCALWCDFLSSFVSLQITLWIYRYYSIWWNVLVFQHFKSSYLQISLLDRHELQQKIKLFWMNRGVAEHWLHPGPFKRVELQKALGNHLSWKDRWAYIEVIFTILKLWKKNASLSFVLVLCYFEKCETAQSNFVEGKLHDYQKKIYDFSQHCIWTVISGILLSLTTVWQGCFQLSL